MPEWLAAESGHALQVREMPRDGMCEVFVTHAGATLGSLAAMAQHLEDWRSARVAAAEYFAPQSEAADPAAARAVLRGTELPLTWVHGGAAGNGLGGAHLRAVAGASVRPLILAGRVVGLVVVGPHAVECTLTGIHALDTGASRVRQAREVYERMERALGLVGLDFRQVVRTWFFLDDILSWYGDFNRVRTAFYEQRGVCDGLLPASTGIGSSNPAGAALVASAYAVRPLSPEVTVQAVPSPLQCPATQYGSSFSRAVEVVMPGLRRLLVSGTASVGTDGRTMHVGNVSAQIARTCEVVAALLESRGMDWGDVTRATAYVRNPEDERVFTQFCAARGLSELPVIVAQAVVCRPDLLFELEVDAVQVVRAGSLT